MKNTARKILAVILASMMLIAVAIPTFAYPKAYTKGDFTDVARDKMAAMQDGDNLFAIGEYDTETYATPAKYSESGDCQFVYAHNNGWGRAIKAAGWSINGMQTVGDGVIDSAPAKAPVGALCFAKKDFPTVNENGVLDENGKYVMLCGWEFAGTFKAKGFKAYFSLDSENLGYIADLDILVGKVVDDEIVWTVAYSGNNLGDILTKVDGMTNNIWAYEADFAETAEGSFVQIAATSSKGWSDEIVASYASYVMTEFEMYSGEVASESIVYGDVDGNGIVNTKDIATLRKFIANLNAETGISSIEVADGADADGNGVINAKDIALLRKYLANLDAETGVSTVVLGPTA